MIGPSCGGPLEELSRRDALRGASTITQQLANLLAVPVVPSRNPSGSFFKEAVTAQMAGIGAGEAAILELYLNAGVGTGTVEAASRRYQPLCPHP